MEKLIRLPMLFMLISVAGCQSSGKVAGGISYTGEPTIIYKMKADYSKNVPVTLNEDGTAIIAYPSPKDVYYKGKLAYPVALSKGWWLDNRGVTPHTAFLKLTYEEYSKLDQAPSLDELMKMIINADPITEIYHLGNRDRFKDEVTEINQVINKGGLKKFKKLK